MEMAYRVELPPMGDMVELTTRHPSSLKTGDTGDSNDQSGQEVPGSAISVPAPAVCPPLPKGVRLVCYRPKQPPVFVAPISIVADVDKFIQVYLGELDARLNHPLQIRAGGSVFEILAKLAEVGLELAIEVASHEG
jgi:hypothetical protein